ncbi:MAG: ABC-type polysaccharide/polyol phosphate export permease [Candidatus Azotimanducaceae bacterium]|jgi:ABC-type polysaccharide/polyol phosphate export permease
MPRLWMRLALTKIKERYQRSVIGAFWITLSTLVMVITFGLLYGMLLDRTISVHLPYVAVGLVFWMFYSDFLIKGCRLFIENSRMIQQLPLAKSVYLYKLTSEELIYLAHNVLIIVLSFVVFLKPVFSVILLLPLGLILLLVNAMSCALIFGIVSTRYRDFPQVITSFMRPMMFITPIIWSVDIRPQLEVFVQFNPFFHLIEICRGPILGYPPTSTNWVVSLVLTIFAAVIALVMFTRYRSKIAYWV